MTKHKCGTCRFFQEARLAGSGWCHHPQRRTTSDVMIMVRRNELACRDQWAHDLWAEAGAEDGAMPNPAAAPIGRLTLRPEPPATAGEIAAIVQAENASPDRNGEGRLQEDVVVGETLVIAESERDWEWQREDAAASRVVNARAAIIKARETYRDRARSSTAGRAEERVPLSAEGVRSPIPDASTAGGGGEGPATDRVGTPPAPPDPSLRRTRDRAPVVDGFDEVPTVVPGFAIPSVERRVEADERPSDAQPSSTALDEPTPITRPEAEVAEHVSASESPSRLHPVRGFPEVGAQRTGSARHRAERRPLEPSLVPVRMERVPVASPRDRSAVDETESDLGLTEERRDEATSLIRGRRGPFRHDPPPVPAREVAERWGGFGGEEEPPWPGDEAIATVDPAAEVDVAGEPEDVVLPTRREDAEPPIDTTVRVAPDLPRVCRMCRDYRPAEGGARGWCANEWAFTHRRVVDPDERMPCETSLGSWWLPVDAIWLASTDVSSHGQPTPILDAVVAHHRSEPLQRRGS